MSKNFLFRLTGLNISPEIILHITEDTIHRTICIAESYINKNMWKSVIHLK